MRNDKRSESNGIVERRVGVISDGVSCLLGQSGLPHGWWTYAAKALCHRLYIRRNSNGMSSWHRRFGQPWLDKDNFAFSQKAQILGHALHEKGLPEEKGIVTLVSSHEERALLVLLINRGSRGSTGHFVPPSVYIGFRLFVLLGRRSGDVSSVLWRVRRRIVP